MDLFELAVCRRSKKSNGGAPGKSAYEYAVEGGYTGTEDDFKTKMAKEFAPAVEGSANGSAISVNDSLDNRFTGLKHYGWSKRATYAGHNQFDVNSVPSDNYYVKVVDGTILVKQRTGDTRECPITPDGWIVEQNIKPGTTYHVSCTMKVVDDPEGAADKNKFNEIYFLGPDNGYYTVLSAGKHMTLGESLTLSSTFTTSGGFTSIQFEQFILYVGTESKTSITSGIYMTSYQTVEISNLMFSEVDAPFEPYTGGKPSPNPEYPQPIVSSGDKGSIETRVMGKNLFDASKIGEYTNNGVTFKNLGNGRISVKGASADSRAESLIIPLSLFPGMYTISLYREEGSINSLQVSFLVSYKRDETRYWNNSNDVNILEGDTDIYAYLSVQKNTSIDAVVIPQLETGSKATSTEPYYPLQSLIFSTPNGFRGIPVKSGGNYTDENGQQWIADYRDWERGVDVQATIKHIFDGTETWRYMSGYGAFLLVVKDIDYSVVPICDKYLCEIGASNIGNEELRISGGLGGVAIRNDAFYSDVSKWKENLSQNPITVLFALKNLIETPIPEDELAAYHALYTNYPNTTVINDENMYTEIKYMADTASYITQNYVPNAQYAELEQRVAALEARIVKDV